MDITRRKTIGLIGGAAAFVIAPVRRAPAEGKRPSAELLAMREKVQAIVDRFDPAPILAGGQYREIFDYVRTAAQGLEDGISSQNGDATWCVKHSDAELGYEVNPDQLGDIEQYLTSLVSVFREYREIQAANVLNAAAKYDPVVGGDGVPLCSALHPVAGGSWSNAMGAGALDASSVARATGLINAFVDARGIRIVVQPKRLLVPISRMLDAELLMLSDPAAFPQRYLANDYLDEPTAWFVLTNVRGLVWSERKPFSLRVEIDPDAERVVVVGHEKRGFGCLDPRSVIGALPGAHGVAAS